jgi:hypothetical protein
VAGLFLGQPARAGEGAEQGANLWVLGTDQSFVVQGAKRALAEMTGARGAPEGSGRRARNGAIWPVGIASVSERYPNGAIFRRRAAVNATTGRGWRGVGQAEIRWARRKILHICGTVVV